MSPLSVFENEVVCVFYSNAGRLYKQSIGYGVWVVYKAEGGGEGVLTVHQQVIVQLHRGDVIFQLELMIDLQGVHIPGKDIAVRTAGVRQPATKHKTKEVRHH